MIIYKITNLINGKAYVGQTTQSINSRISKHINAKDGYRPLTKAIRKYGKDNFKIEIIDWANHQTELNYKEWLWIYKLNTISPSGYNLKDGGRNGAISEKQKKIISLANSKRAWTEESKNKISLANKGRKRIPTSLETREMLSNNAKKQWSDKDTRKKMQSSLKLGIRKACGVKVVDITNGKVYETATDAELDNNKKNINAHLNGKCKTFNKKVFKYLSDWDGNLISKEQLEKLNENIFAKKVLCLDNNVVYVSASEASRQLNLRRRSICRVCDGSRKHTKGYRFQYV